MDTFFCQQGLEYLRCNYAGYMTHINSIFNFFLLFAGLVLNAIAIVIQKGLHNSTSADEIFAVFGSVISPGFSWARWSH